MDLLGEYGANLLGIKAVRKVWHIVNLVDLVIVVISLLPKVYGTE